MLFMSSFGQSFFIAIFAGHLREVFGISHGQWGGIYMLGTTGSALVMVWAGALTDVFRVRVLGPAVLIGLALACVVMATNHSLWLLPLSIFLLRFLGQGMSGHIGFVAMSRWFIASRGKAMSIASLGYSVGEAILPLIFVALMAWFDWRSLWLIAAVLCLVGIALLYPLLGQERTPQMLAATQSGPGMDGRQWTRAQALRTPVFWLIALAMLGLPAFNTAIFFHQVHLAEVKGWSHVQLVALFPVFTLSTVVSVFVFGWAIDRYSSVRLVPFHQIPVIAAFVVFSLADSPPAMLLGYVLLGTTAGAHNTLFNAFWAEVFGTAHLGAIKALAAAVMVLGSAIGPGLTGLGIDIGFELEAQFVAIACWFALSTTVIVVAVAGIRTRLPGPAAD